MTDSEQTSVLITGGNKGLGFEAARRLGERGWTIFLGSRDEGRGREAADKLTDGGANVVMVPLDVTSDESVSDAVRLVREHASRLDVLINNAGAPGKAIAPADATVNAAEPNSDIKVQVRKGHRMFLASVIEPHTSMSTINSRSFRYAGVC